jgi:hypothetical protein
MRFWMLWVYPFIRRDYRFGGAPRHETSRAWPRCQHSHLARLKAPEGDGLGDGSGLGLGDGNGLGLGEGRGLGLGEGTGLGLGDGLGDGDGRGDGEGL